MVTSFLGLYAAFSFQGTKGNKRRTHCFCTLFLHLIFNFVGVACLVYGAAFVLIFADDADEMIIIFWTFTKGALPSSMTQNEAVTWFHQHLNGAASVLIVCAILLLICIVCDSHLLGHDLTARRIVITTNIGTMLLGIGFIVVAAMNKYHNSIVHKDDVYLPYVAGGVGVCTFVISLVGIVAVCGGKQRPKLLCFYSFLMVMLSSSLVVVAIISFQKKNQIKQWVKMNWAMIEKKYIGVTISEDDFANTLHQHLNLIGLSASIIACTLVFNTIATIIFWCSQRKRIRNYTAAERRELFDGSDEEYSSEEEEAGGNGGNGGDVEMASRKQSRSRKSKRSQPTSM